MSLSPTIRVDNDHISNNDDSQLPLLLSIQSTNAVIWVLLKDVQSRLWSIQSTIVWLLTIDRNIWTLIRITDRSPYHYPWLTVVWNRGNNKIGISMYLDWIHMVECHLNEIILTCSVIMPVICFENPKIQNNERLVEWIIIIPVRKCQVGLYTSDRK